MAAQPPGTPVYLEDLAEKPLWGKDYLLLAAVFFPEGATRMALREQKDRLTIWQRLFFPADRRNPIKSVDALQRCLNVDQLNQVFMPHKTIAFWGIRRFSFVRFRNAVPEQVGIELFIIQVPWTRHRRAGKQVSRDAVAGDADFFAGVYAAMRA